MSAGIIFRKDVGKRLRQLRHDKGDSIETVAKFLSIPQSTLQSNEAGLQFPTLSNVMKLANYYNIRVDWIATGAREFLTRDLKVPLDHTNEGRAKVRRNKTT